MVKLHKFCRFSRVDPGDHLANQWAVLVSPMFNPICLSENLHNIALTLIWPGTFLKIPPRIFDAVDLLSLSFLLLMPVRPNNLCAVP